MKLLAVIEGLLESIDSWPSFIILGMFTYSPVDLSSTFHLMEAIAFLYGNKVPLDVASQFFNACAGRPLGNVLSEFTKWYGVWDEACDTPHMSSYYNMHMKRYTWINGKYLSQTEPLEPQPVLHNVGLERTGMGHILRGKLRGIKEYDLIQEKWPRPQ